MVLMHVLRKVTLSLLSIVLPILLFSAALDYGILHIAGSADQVKKIANESGVYGQIVPGLLDQVKQLDTSAGQVPLSDPAIRNLAIASLPPEQVKIYADDTIDSIYAWLDGKTAEPTFNIDLSSFQANFANKLGGEAATRATRLPPCATAYTGSSFDVFNATCLPRGLTADQISAVVQNQVKNGNDLVKNPTISASQIKNASGQSVFAAQYKDVPKQYRLVKKLPALLIGLTIVTIIAITLLSPNHWRALRHIGITLITVGCLLLVFAWATNKANQDVLQPHITLKNTVMQTNIRRLVTDLVQSVDKNYWIFGIIYTSTGILAVAAPSLLNRGPKDKTEPEQEKPVEPPKPPKAGPKKVTKITVL
jgi:hypothetical protein